MQKNLLLQLFTIVSCLSAHNSLAQTDNSLLSLTQQRQPLFIKELSTLVNIDSGTGDAKGLKKVEAFLSKRLKKLDAQVETIAAPPAVGKVILGRFQGNGTKNILLMIHYDTVFNAGEALKRSFKIVGDKAFGPGVADAKGGVLLILHALEIARQRGFKDYKTLTVLFNPDEEKSSLGSRAVIQALAAEQDAVLSFEPPDAERVIVATNGIAHVHLQVKGLAAHAGSAPEKGRNAALELSHQIVQLQDLGNPAKGTTVNWTMLSAGTKANIIPDQAEATADMRMSDLTELGRVQADADKHIQQHLIPDTGVKVQVEQRRPPFIKNAATDNLATRANAIYQELGKNLEPVAMRYGTDAGFAYNPNNSKPAVLEGMGIVGDRIHSPDEWADLTSIAPRLYLTVRMLEDLSR